MSKVSEIWTWQEGGRTYSRFTTNVSAKNMLHQLRMIGVLDSIETIHAYFGDRVSGGSGYEVLWKTSADWEHLRCLFAKL